MAGWQPAHYPRARGLQRLHDRGRAAPHSTALLPLPNAMQSRPFYRTKPHDARIALLPHRLVLADIALRPSGFRYIRVAGWHLTSCAQRGLAHLSIHGLSRHFVHGIATAALHQGYAGLAISYAPFMT